MKLIFNTLLFILAIGSVQAQLWQENIVPSFIPLPPPGYQSELKGYDIQETSDGNYVFAGSYKYGLSPNYTYTPVLVKLNASTGNVMWIKEFLNFSSTLQEVSLAVKPNGNLLLAGLNYNRIFLIETDFNGNLNSSQQYMSTCESANNVDCSLNTIRLRPTNDGNYIIGVGATGGFIGIPQPINQLMKITPNHAVIWNKDFYHRYLLDFQPTSDGGYILSGRDASGPNILYKLDAMGDSVWQQPYYFSQEMNSVKETPDHGFVVASYITGIGGNSPYLFKVDSVGTTVEWQTSLGHYYGKAHHVIVDPNGNYAVTGTLQVPHGGSIFTVVDAAYITKVSPTGTLIQSQVFDDLIDNSGRTVRHTSDGNFVVAGSHGMNSSYQKDGYAVKTGYLLNSITLEQEEVTVNVFPNPFQEQTTLEVEGENYRNLEVHVFDALGRQVEVSSSNNGSQITVTRNNLDSGVYWFKLIGDQEVIGSGKLIVQ